MGENITIQVVGYNSVKDLVKTLPHLSNAVRRLDWAVTIRYIDNNSTDDSVKVLRRFLPQAEVVELKENKGFSQANNIGFSLCRTEFIMLHNPDLFVNGLGVSHVLAAFQDKRVAAAQGLLYRDKKQTIVDSAGIEMTLALNGREINAGLIDKQLPHRSREIAAVTGAAGIYRLSALRQVAGDKQEVFDQDFFAYKEEVDLGWRLRKAGFRCVYVPVTHGVHWRSLRSYRRRDFIIHPRLLTAKLSDQRTKYSFRNWAWMIIKNITAKDVLKHALFIGLRIICFLLLSLVYWPLLSVWPAIFKGLPTMLRKRAAIRSFN